jgi:Transposase IS116/IS110/IS902 family
VHQHAKADPRVKVLTQLPGVGPFTALVLLAETGDIGRFGSARKLASWAGLTPTVRGSDRTVRHGHISKQGSVWARWVLCEAAQTANPHRTSRPATRPSPAAAASHNQSPTPTTAAERPGHRVNSVRLLDNWGPHGCVNVLAACRTCWLAPGAQCRAGRPVLPGSLR